MTPSISRARNVARAAAFAAVAAFGLAACTSSGNQTTPVAALVAEEAPKPASTGPRQISNKAIPILVNDVPITQFDINQRVRLMRIGGAGGSTQKAAEELIDETLQSLEAQRRGVRISDSQVDAAFASIAERLNMSPTQLTAALRSEGIEAPSLKKRLRAQMTWQRLVQQRTQTRGTVRSEDITAALLEKGDPNQLTVTEYVLQQIVFVVPSGSSSNLYQQRRREAEQFRQRFQGCESALEQARQLRGVVVKDIGRRDSSQLSGPEGDTIRKTRAGTTTAPFQSDQGVELIAVCSTRDVNSSSAARAEVENSMYLAQAENLGADYLKELRDLAIIEYR